MKTEYTLSKHRFYELKHFCLQYKNWIDIYNKADGWIGKGDTTSRDGIKRATMKTYIDLIEDCARLTGIDILPYVIDEGRSLPVELRYFYRMFFWILSQKR